MADEIMRGCEGFPRSEDACGLNAIARDARGAPGWLRAMACAGLHR
jgi:hypothetical protein